MMTSLTAVTLPQSSQICFWRILIPRGWSMILLLVYHGYSSSIWTIIRGILPFILFDILLTYLNSSHPNTIFCQRLSHTYTLPPHPHLHCLFTCRVGLNPNDDFFSLNFFKPLYYSLCMALMVQSDDLHELFYVLCDPHPDKIARS